VQALVRMRELRAASAPTSLDEDAVLALCLAPPRQVPRTAEGPFETPVVDRGLCAGTVLVLQLAKAGTQAPDPEMVFMHGHWNACPARAFVPGLLLAVWHRSLEGAEGA
jgi:hypothetical protein